MESPSSIALCSVPNKQIISNKSWILLVKLCPIIEFAYFKSMILYAPCSCLLLGARWNKPAAAWQSKLRSEKPVDLLLPLRCIVGLYVKPAWRPPVPERFVRSAGLFWSLRPPVDPLSFPIRRVMWSSMAPGEPSATEEPRCGLKCCPLCVLEAAGCWAAPSCSVEVWGCTRPSNSGSSSTWPRRRPRWVCTTRCWSRSDCHTWQDCWILHWVLVLLPSDSEGHLDSWTPGCFDHRQWSVSLAAWNKWIWC